MPISQTFIFSGVPIQEEKKLVCYGHLTYLIINHMICKNWDSPLVIKKLSSFWDIFNLTASLLKPWSTNFYSQLAISSASLWHYKNKWHCCSSIYELLAHISTALNSPYLHTNPLLVEEWCSILKYLISPWAYIILLINNVSNMWRCQLFA